tara:strand:+ start:10871 stop:13027 length:2157 start_codon:yes stop_codon:yes gene_type:complete
MRIFYFFILICFNSVVFGQSCPFKASDSNAISMASNTAGTIQGLLDAKNQCSATFTEAVKSVQGLPELLNAAKDPVLELKAKKDFLNREIAKSLSDPSYASESKSGYYDNYLEYLLSQRSDIDKQIAEEQVKSKYQTKENSKEKVLSLTWNLLAASSNALNDPNSPCAQNISNRFGTQLLTLGMGALSSAGYLVSQAAGGGVTLAAGLLSQIMDLFSKMPERGALRDFEQNNQTYDLACLYHNIVTMSCEMKSSIGKKTGQSFIDQANKIPNAKIYSKVLSTKEINTDLSSVIMAVVTQDISQISDGSGSSVDKKISDLFGKEQTVSPKEVYEKQLQQFDFFKSLFIPNRSGFDALTGDQQSTVSMYLDFLISNIRSNLESEGIQTRQPNGSNINPVIIFTTNSAAIEKILRKKLKDSSGGESSNLISFDNLRDLHRGINAKDLRAKNKFTVDTYDDIKKYLKESNLENTTDGKSLILQIDEVQKVLGNFDNWLSVDPGSPEYQSSLNKAASELKKSLGAKSDDGYTLREKVKFLMAQPLAKFQQMVGEGKKLDDDNVFSNPFVSKQKALSDFDRYGVLRDVYKTVSDPRLELKDINLVNDTRQLFEADSSTLRKNFLAGLKGLRERMSSSPDPEVSRKMLSQLCGLAYSLPSGGSPHASDDCSGLLPKDMQPFMRVGKETPDCSYYRYVNEKTRTEYFETGKQPSLPSESNSGQGVK